MKRKIKVNVSLKNVLPVRLKKVLPLLISSQETAYVANRCISQSGNLISDLLDVTEKVKTKGIPKRYFSIIMSTFGEHLLQGTVLKGCFLLLLLLLCYYCKVVFLSKFIGIQNSKQVLHNWESEIIEMYKVLIAK